MQSDSGPTAWEITHIHYSCKGTLEWCTSILPPMVSVLCFRTHMTLIVIIVSMRRDYVSKLRPPKGLLFMPQVIYELGVP